MSLKYCATSRAICILFSDKALTIFWACLLPETVKDVLPESTNDFVYSAIAEDWGAIGCIALLLLLLLVLNKLVNHAIHAHDNMVIYALAGTAALFGGQICFNLMTALHLIISKGMTLPFISYGGVSFVTFCIIFGMMLSLIREDTWNK